MAKVIVSMPREQIIGADIWDCREEFLEMIVGDHNYTIREIEGCQNLRVTLYSDRKSDEILEDLKRHFHDFEIETISEEEYYQTRLRIPPGVMSGINEMCSLVDSKLKPVISSVMLSSMGMINPDSIDVNLVTKTADREQLLKDISSLNFEKYIIEEPPTGGE